mmetsp:Transcript_23726/g.69903  ORF Transcript_23726/g.69903 Transcript_23726/m.69903 type:complete len:298 (+) Transcript_23726:126-1019(+)
MGGTPDASSRWRQHCGGVVALYCPREKTIAVHWRAAATELDRHVLRVAAVCAGGEEVIILLARGHEHELIPRVLRHPHGEDLEYGLEEEGGPVKIHLLEGFRVEVRRHAKGLFEHGQARGHVLVLGQGGPHACRRGPSLSHILAAVDAAVCVPVARVAVACHVRLWKGPEVKDVRGSVRGVCRALDDEHDRAKVCAGAHPGGAGRVSVVHESDAPEEHRLARAVAQARVAKVHGGARVGVVHEELTSHARTVEICACILAPERSHLLQAFERRSDGIWGVLVPLRGEEARHETVCVG